MHYTLGAEADVEMLRHGRSLEMTSFLRVLGSAANGSPSGEGFQVVPVFPGQRQKFAGIRTAASLPTKVSNRHWM